MASVADARQPRLPVGASEWMHAPHDDMDPPPAGEEGEGAPPRLWGKESAETGKSPFAKWVLTTPPVKLGRGLPLVEVPARGKPTPAKAILPGWSAVLDEGVY